MRLYRCDRRLPKKKGRVRFLFRIHSSTFIFYTVRLPAQLTARLGQSPTPPQTYYILPIRLVASSAVTTPIFPLSSTNLTLPLLAANLTHTVVPPRPSPPLIVLPPQHLISPFLPLISPIFLVSHTASPTPLTMLGPSSLCPPTFFGLLSPLLTRAQTVQPPKATPAFPHLPPLLRTLLGPPNLNA